MIPDVVTSNSASIFPGRNVVSKLSLRCTIAVLSASTRSLQVRFRNGALTCMVVVGDHLASKVIEVTSTRTLIVDIPAEGMFVAADVVVEGLNTPAQLLYAHCAAGTVSRRLT